MKSHTLIALVGAPGSGKSAIAAGLSKEMPELTEFVELRDESWHLDWQGNLPDIFVFVEIMDTTSTQERIQEQMIKFADLHSIPFLTMRNINLNLELNIPILNKYIIEKITAYKNAPDERRQYWEDEFEEYQEDGNFTWALTDPMPLQMFFDKTREKNIPLSIPSITSMIARCIENNLSENVLRQILEFSKSMNVTGDLYLRRVKNIDYLILAASYGFQDPEFTKRIVDMQRAARKQEPATSSFAGRQPGDSPEYYGYRHAMYFVRYHPRQRLTLFTHANHGGCNWQAYADLTGDEIPDHVCQEMKKRSIKNKI